ncbi:MAG: TIGR04283 family arsenosugar biosynthesis glycosyltransferase [Opitutaceae bacterium]|nr:TIGR04283 family arsenosugar biosynthesis glycosyltransferase [Opitutaceae bacterium]
MISVIIPTLNEAAAIAETIGRVRAALPEAEIIVADGGSDDRTATAATIAGAVVVAAPRGRGLQLAAGAAVARGDPLVFLHADTWLPPNAGPILARAFARPEVRIGTFRLAFDQAGPFLGACAWLTRIDSVFTRFGDQAIVVRRDCYTELGGFPAWPLFEDVELLRRARRVTRVWSFPACVTTSARRFRRHGALRQQWLNARLLLRFLRGTPPHVLAAEYRAGVTAAATRATSRRDASLSA